MAPMPMGGGGFGPGGEADYNSKIGRGGGFGPGGSGGGLLTNWVIAHTHRFAAAITQRCVADWAGMWYSSDFSMFTPFWFRKPPFEDPGKYRERSPVHLAPQVTTPLLVIHSEEDWRCPIGQGEGMFRALLRQVEGFGGNVVMTRADHPSASSNFSQRGSADCTARNRPSR